MHPTLAYIEDLARRAGEILRTGYGQQHQIEYKGEADLVTEVDRASEALILGEIMRHFPEHSIFSEESGERSGNAEHTWFVDPLDGTLNYAHGMRTFCISIAYEHRGQLQLAAVYDPMANELFSAERGQGAWLNGERIQVSNPPSLRESLLVTGFPYDVRTNPRNNFAEFERFSRLSQGVRRLGSAALDMCYVAAGRLDGYWQLKLSAWDLAAGALLVQEAGGVASGVLGQTEFLREQNGVLAAGPGVYAEMLGVLKEMAAG
ncbi:MAG: inositol monophosphatase [Anaerolineales bacterium]|nr:MAG: inositol monophosphatase [Anaerolineales bacterium]